MSQKSSLSSDAVGQKLAEQTFRDMGLDPKSGKFQDGEKTRGERANASAPNPSYPSPNPSCPSPVSSYHIKVPTTPFRIKTIEKTRYQSPTGTTYRYSALYRNAVVLQLLVEKWTHGLDPRRHHRLIAQVNDAARSMIANIAEGYARPTTKEYLEYLGFSRASLEEITTDIVHARDTGLLASRPESNMASLGIILKPASPPPNPSYPSPISSYDPLGELKRKIGEIKRHDLTFEIFLELTNKTTYLYKRTVEGLWSKLSRDEHRALNESLASIVGS